MNQRPLSAAYEGMTSRELAAAAYAHADNELESLRIKAAIPWKTYSMMDVQFIDALEHLHLMGYLWANDYWRLEFLHVGDVLGMAYHHIKGDIKKRDGYVELLAGWKKIIAAHFEALKEVCEAHGIDYKTVLKRISITEDADRTAGLDLEHKTRVIAALETFLAVGE